MRLRRHLAAAAVAVIVFSAGGCAAFKKSPENVDPTLVDLVDYRNALMMLREGRVDEALQLLTRAKTVSPNDPNVPNAMGLALLYKKSYAASHKAFSEALKLDPSFVEALNNRGVCLMEQGKYDEAEVDFNGVLDGLPSAEKVNAHYNLGILKKKKGLWVDAEREFSLALADDYQYRPAYRERGLVRIKAEKFNEALQDFLSVLKTDAKDPVANYQAALCLLATGRRDLATRYMERAVQAAPESDEGRKAKRFLDTEPRS